MKRFSRSAALRGGSMIPLGSSLSLASNISVRHGSTYFDKLDQFWNSTWISFSPREYSIESVSGVLQSMHDAGGLDMAAAFFLLGVGIRALTLPFAFYGDRATSRMQHAVPELAADFARFEEVYYNPRATSLAIQTASAELKAERNKAYLKWNTSNKATMSILCGSPLVLLGFSSVLRVTSDPVKYELASDLVPWVMGLHMADPTMILPIACAGFTLLNTEMSFRVRKIDSNQQWSRNALMCMRLGCLCLVPTLSSWYSGVLLYWLGLSACGLLQPLLLSQTWFRNACGILDPPEHTAQAANPVVKDILQTRVALQMPTIAKVISPDSEDAMRSRENERIRLERMDQEMGRRVENMKAQGTMRRKERGF